MKFLRESITFLTLSIWNAKLTEKIVQNIIESLYKET